MSDVKLTWRNVFECKTPGETTTGAAEKAMAAGYPLFLHNDRVYEIRGNGYVATWFTVRDVR